jgi:periplasmic protein TonB
MERLYTFTPGFWLSALLHAIVFLFLLTKSQHQLVEIISKPQVLPDFVVEQMTPSPVMKKVEPVTEPQKVTPPKPIVKTPVKPPVQQPVKQVVTPPVAAHPKTSEQGEVSVKQESKTSEAPSVVEATVKEEQDKVKSEPLAKSPAIQAPQQAPQVVQPSKDVSLTGWAEYGRNLTRACANLRYYPPVAASNHWSGVVIVSVQYSAGGGVELNVRQTSGYKILDSAAINMVDQAIKSLPVPDSLKDKPTKIFIPIGFYS